MASRRGGIGDPRPPEVGAALNSGARGVAWAQMDDRNEYEPSFGTRLRWTFIIVGTALVIFLVAATVFG